MKSTVTGGKLSTLSLGEGILLGALWHQDIFQFQLALVSNVAVLDAVGEKGSKHNDKS
jgi:hypothetical protein